MRSSCLRAPAGLTRPRRAMLGGDDTYFRRPDDLRHARRMTQVALAERLHMVQPSVSRLERQADLSVSTLRHYIEAIDRDNPDVSDTDPELRTAL